jgi:hypothetical protein
MKVFDPNQKLNGLSNEEIWTDSPTMVSTRIIDSLLKFPDSMNGTREDNNIQHNRRDNQTAGHTEGRGRGQRGAQNYRGKRGSAIGRGRQNYPEHRYGSRGSKGGHRDFRARPY